MIRVAAPRLNATRSRRVTTLASRTELCAAPPGLGVRESKLLFEDDVLVSLLEFEAATPGKLEVRAASPLVLAPRPRPAGSTRA